MGTLIEIVIMAGHLVGTYKFHSEDNHRAFLKAMGAPEPMIDKMMSQMENEKLMFKDNGNGTWSMENQTATGFPLFNSIKNLKRIGVTIANPNPFALWKMDHWSEKRKCQIPTRI